MGTARYSKSGPPTNRRPQFDTEEHATEQAQYKKNSEYDTQTKNVWVGKKGFGPLNDGINMAGLARFAKENLIKGIEATTPSLLPAKRLIKSTKGAGQSKGFLEDTMLFNNTENIFAGRGTKTDVAELLAGFALAGKGGNKAMKLVGQGLKKVRKPLGALGVYFGLGGGDSKRP